jgi:AraC-like DNA-binding protein
MARFSRVVADPAESATLARGDRFSFIIRWRPGVPPPSEHSIDAILATVVGQCRLMLDRSVTPIEVTVRRGAPPSPTAYAARFGCPVTFDARDSRVVFDREVVEQRMPTGEVELARRNDDVVAGYLATLDGQRSLSACVRAALVAALPSGAPTAPAIARTLATSSRSMQRHLCDEGTSFRELLQEVRCDMAISYLRSGTHTIAETAALLGFGDVTAFSRAFKRWTGRSPSRLP